MRIGIDFDNTIVRYDGVIAKIAIESGMAQAGTSISKTELRNRFRAQGREGEWTKIQGTLYGECIVDAVPFPGVKKFLAAATEAGNDLFVVSHRTRAPYSGPPLDLHAVARRWLDANGISKSIPPDRVHFETTKDDKLARIKDLEFDAFIDDLPEIFLDAAFPDSAVAVLFDPADEHRAKLGMRVARTWDDIADLLLRRAP